MHWVLPWQKQIQCKFKQNMRLSGFVSSDYCARTRHPQNWPELSIWRGQVTWWVAEMSSLKLILKVKENLKKCEVNFPKNKAQKKNTYYLIVCKLFFENHSITSMLKKWFICLFSLNEC